MSDFISLVCIVNHKPDLATERDSLTMQLREAEDQTETVSSELEKVRMEVKQQGSSESQGFKDEQEEELRQLSIKVIMLIMCMCPDVLTLIHLQVSTLESQLESRTNELISCKKELATLKVLPLKPDY